MPTPTGLPKVGEVWELTQKFPPDWKPQSTRVIVLERSRGDYWSLRVATIIERDGSKFWDRKLWVDPAAWFSRGELKYIGPAGPKAKQALGLG